MNASAKLLLVRARNLAAGEPVPSPCLSICRMDDAKDWCEGCFRTLQEIAQWSRLDDEAKRVVWRDIVKRVSA